MLYKADALNSANAAHCIGVNRFKYLRGDRGAMQMCLRTAMQQDSVFFRELLELRDAGGGRRWEWVQEVWADIDLFPLKDSVTPQISVAVITQKQ